jgi:hypothetical protein
MAENPRCPRCGGELTGQTVGGLCANCLLRLAMEPPLGSAPGTVLADEPAIASASSETGNCNFFPDWVTSKRLTFEP